MSKTSCLWALRLLINIANLLTSKGGAKNNMSSIFFENFRFCVAWPALSRQNSGGRACKVVICRHIERERPIGASSGQLPRHLTTVIAISEAAGDPGIGVCRTIEYLWLLRPAGGGFAAGST